MHQRTSWHPGMAKLLAPLVDFRLVPTDLHLLHDYWVLGAAVLRALPANAFELAENLGPPQQTKSPHCHCAQEPVETKDGHHWLNQNLPHHRRICHWVIVSNLVALECSSGQHSLLGSVCQKNSDLLAPNPWSPEAKRPAEVCLGSHAWRGEAVMLLVRRAPPPATGLPHQQSAARTHRALPGKFLPVEASQTQGRCQEMNLRGMLLNLGCCQSGIARASLRGGFVLHTASLVPPGAAPRKFLNPLDQYHRKTPAWRALHGVTPADLFAWPGASVLQSANSLHPGRQLELANSWTLSQARSV